MHDDRIQPLNDCEPAEGRYVLYMMEQAQRTAHNHALAHAAAQANDCDLPLAVAVALNDDEAPTNARMRMFELEGLADVADELKRMNAAFAVFKGAPGDVALDLAQNAAIVVCDRGYLRDQRKWRDTLAGKVDRPVIQVEGEVVVPVESATDKREYAARTIRPKLEKQWEDYVDDFDDVRPKNKAKGLDLGGDIDPSDPEKALKKLAAAAEPVPVGALFPGGQGAAGKRLKRFLKERLDGYADRRNDAAQAGTSELSPYLRFGQISPVAVARAAHDATADDEDKGSFLEELIVRRELAINYVAFEPEYDSLRALPEWAAETLQDHRDDKRPERYTAKEIEAAETDDPYWNAAMTEAKATGFMHNYMRMYWAKKILEWSGVPETAHRLTLELMNRYFLDGRSPSTYACVAWTFGLHDRAWTERSVYGKVRYMKRESLGRKFDADGYVERVEKLADDAG